MTIPALPPLVRTSPTFRTDLDAFFLTQLPSTVTEFNITANEVNANRVAAAASAAIALNAVAVGNSVAWVSGTTYAIGDARYSPINFASYRRKTAGAGTSDPSIDAANWARIDLSLATPPDFLFHNLGVI